MKLIVPQPPGKSLRLFDLAEDPGEQHDVSAERPELASEMRRRLLSVLSRQRAARSQDPERRMDAGLLERLQALGYAVDDAPRSED